MALIVSLTTRCSTPATRSPGRSTAESPRQSQVAAVVEQTAPTTPVAEPQPAPEPQLEPVTVRSLSVHSPIDEATAEHLRNLAATRETTANVFAKLGGSSVESRAFLQCIGHDTAQVPDELRDVVAFFTEGRIGREDPFERISLAARKGWSLRQGLSGRPSYVAQELDATRAQISLAFFGGNDVQSRHPLPFGDRMEDLLALLEQRGSIPILSSVFPRGDRDEMDVAARRFNRVSRGLALAWHVPYIDVYDEAKTLPHWGLAGDRVHPNVMQEGHRTFPCNLTAAGLQFGHNLRNLRTLESLQRVRRALAGQASDATSGVSTQHGNEIWVQALPFGHRHQPRADEHTSLCPEVPVASRSRRRPDPTTTWTESVYRIRLAAETRIWIAAFPSASRIALREQESCRSLENDSEVTLPAGEHSIVVRSAEARTLLLDVVR